MNEEEFAELAAGHALRALTDADEQRYAQALAAHPEWEDVAAVDAQTVALLAESVSSVKPPSGIRDALLSQIADLTPPPGDLTPPPVDDSAPAGMTAQNTTAQDAPAESTPDEPAAPRRWGRMIFALAASVALILGISVGVAVLTAQLRQPASVMALEQIESSEDAQTASVDLDSGGTATAHWSQSVGEAVLVTEGLAELGDDGTYQLWLVRGEDALSAGLFETDAGETTSLLDGSVQEGDVIAVTVEPAGGSPTGQPTSDPIIVIPTA